MLLYKPLAIEYSNLSKALSYVSQVIEGLGSLLEAGLGGTCIVHIIAGILCFLDNSQQEIPGANLSTFYFNKIFREKKRKESKSYRTKLPILTSNHSYVKFFCASFVILFFPLKDL